MSLTNKKIEIIKRTHYDMPAPSGMLDFTADVANISIDEKYNLSNPDHRRDLFAAIIDEALEKINFSKNTYDQMEKEFAHAVQYARNRILF